MLKDSHRVSIYRRSPAASAGGGESQFDAPTPAEDGWDRIAADVPAAFDPSSGGVRLTAHGTEVKIAGTLFVHPSRLPAGVALQPGDGVDVLAGPIVEPGRFTVAEVRVLGGGRWDDELDLESTAEAFE